MLKCLKRERKGAGGLFLILVAFLMAIAMIVSINLSRTSYTISMCDAIGQVVSTKCAIYLYNTQALTTTMSGSNVEIRMNTLTDVTYKPLDDFNKICREYFIIGPNEEFHQYRANNTHQAWVVDTRTEQKINGPWGGKVSHPSTQCYVEWHNGRVDGGRSYVVVQFNELVDTWGREIRPHYQTSVIETDIV